MINLNKFLLSTFAIFSFLVPAVVAQDADENIEEVVVTGSRIQNPNIVSSSQVQVVDAADIENRGAIRIEEVLNDLASTCAWPSCANC
jgi:outer membrane cobalamin receptor